MSRCWPEGALRAHLDRELTPEEMELVATHLEQCADCARLSTELAMRAERVEDWMDALPVPQLAWVTPAPRRVAAGGRWIGLAAALAAGVLMAAWLLPSHNAKIEPPAPVATAAVNAGGEPAAVVALPAPRALLSKATLPKPTLPKATLSKNVSRTRPAVRSANNEFLALDDEPIETGVVMRVGVEPGNVQADIVFGPDGRAHAIRLVSSRN